MKKTKTIIKNILIWIGGVFIIIMIIAILISAEKQKTIEPSTRYIPIDREELPETLYMKMKNNDLDLMKKGFMDECTKEAVYHVHEGGEHVHRRTASIMVVIVNTCGTCTVRKHPIPIRVLLRGQPPCR